MGIRRVLLRAVTVVAITAGLAVVAPGAVFADTPSPQAATLTATTAVEAPTATAGTDLQVCAYYNGTLRGCGYFYDYGEHLYACDNRADGRSVTAQLYWSGAIRASVSDTTDSGCGHRNLSIAEGRTVYLRTCVQGVGCTAWLRGTA